MSAKRYKSDVCRAMYDLVVKKIDTESLCLDMIDQMCDMCETVEVVPLYEKAITCADKARVMQVVQKLSERDPSALYDRLLPDAIKWAHSLKNVFILHNLVANRSDIMATPGVMQAALHAAKNGSTESVKVAGMNIISQAAYTGNVFSVPGLVDVVCGNDGPIADTVIYNLACDNSPLYDRVVGRCIKRRKFKTLHALCFNLDNRKRLPDEPGFAEAISVGLLQTGKELVPVLELVHRLGKFTDEFGNALIRGLNYNQPTEVREKAIAAVVAFREKALAFPGLLRALMILANEDHWLHKNVMAVFS